MIQFEDSVKVTIDLENRVGMFIFNGKGALGKTYLAQVFSRNHDNENLYVRTVKDKGMYERGNIDTARILLFDKADLYFDNELVSLINKYGRSKPILLDLKTSSFIDSNHWNVDFGIAKIDLAKSEISVGVLL